MHSVEFRYKIGQRVMILEIERPGRVDALALDVNGTMYRVVYWNDGARRCEWMYEWEVKRPC